jgi:hypothetical protein
MKKKTNRARGRKSAPAPRKKEKKMVAKKATKAEEVVGPIYATEDQQDKPKPVVPDVVVIAKRKDALVEKLNQALRIIGSSDPMNARALIESALDEVHKAHLHWPV